MKVKFTLLGTGSSMGVPRPDGFFGKCDPNNKKNYRTRCSALISFDKTNVLIDTSPDLRHQLLTKKISSIDTVLYTHFHADQTHGINDLRVFYLKKQKKITVYSDKLTAKYLYDNFSYCFVKKYDYPAILALKPLKKNFTIGDIDKNINIKPIKSSQKTKLKIVGGLFEHQTILFTGFRDERISEFLTKHNGTIVNAIHKKLNLLIVKNKEYTNGKTEAAQLLGIPILTKDEFINKYFNHM